MSCGHHPVIGQIEGWVDTISSQMWKEWPRQVRADKRGRLWTKLRHNFVKRKQTGWAWWICVIVSLCAHIFHSINIHVSCCDLWAYTVSSKAKRDFQFNSLSTFKMHKQATQSFSLPNESYNLAIKINCMYSSTYFSLSFFGKNIPGMSKN